MSDNNIHNTIIDFLNSREKEEEPIVSAEDKEFAQSLAVMWAAEKVERDKLKQHFQTLDKAYKTRIVDLQTKHDAFNEEKVASLMKAALDDVTEQAPDQFLSRSTSLIPDDVIRAFLSDDDSDSSK